jgi:dipeptidyl-peptidase-4
MKIRILFFLFIIAPVLIVSTQAQDKELKYSQILMRGEPRLLGALPSLLGWADDNHYLQRKNEQGKSIIVKINANTGEEEIFFDYSDYDENLSEGLTLDQSIANTPEYDGFLFEKDNDVFYYSRSKNELKRLTNNNDEEKNPTFSPDGKKIAYTRNNNLFVADIETGKEFQITFDGSDVVYNGWASWVYYEEILGRESNYAAFWWAPNSEQLAFLRFDDSPVPKFPLYKADGSHGELEWAHYPKAGDPNPLVKLGVANLKDGKTLWIDETEKTDCYIAWPFWTPDSRQLFYQSINRAQDSLTIYSADPLSGIKKIVYSEYQPSWVEFFNNIDFLRDYKGFIIKSDKDGWSHLYWYDMEGKLVKQITSGNWAVREIILIDETNKKIYFQGSVNDQNEQHLNVVDFDGNNLTQLTKTNGWHSCKVSPSGKYFYDRYSSINSPSRLELFDSRGNLIKQLGDSKLPAFNEFKLGKVELFTIPSGDGYNLPGKWILPPGFDQSKKYPVIFSIYGGPGAATVRHSFPFWMFPFYLAQQGIIYFELDNRGSGHFGKKGSAEMHRNCGLIEMNDLIAAVKWLKEKSFIDTSKIGITGGSYGGYVTCMALTYGADYFNYGIAEYSVTDWHLYDNVYTERYMDKPDENPEGYKFGSALTHADKYKGCLLITHGTLDDNVHMQNTIQLVDKLTDLDKDFELMLYPDSRHGVGWPKFIHAMREQVQFWFRHLLGRDFNPSID